MEVDVMARIRIHELAKKLGKENKEILNYLTEKGIQVKSPMNSLEEEQVAMVEDKFGKKETKPEGKAEAAEEKKAPAKKKAFSFKSFLDMFSSPQKISQGAEFYFCYSSVFIPLSLNSVFRRSTDDELSAVFVRINALSAAI